MRQPDSRKFDRPDYIAAIPIAVGKRGQISLLLPPVEQWEGRLLGPAQEVIPVEALPTILSDFGNELMRKFLAGPGSE